MFEVKEERLERRGDDGGKIIRRVGVEEDCVRRVDSSEDLR